MKTAFLHYSAAPIVGGVENVMHAHAEQFANAEFPLTIIAGRGEKNAMPPGVDFIKIDEIDSMNPKISAATQELNKGIVPASFDELANSLLLQLRPILSEFDHVIIHNVMTKHFNLPLTAALFRLMDEGVIKHPIIWSHDLSWSSPNSRSKVFPAYPWNLLKTIHTNATYVTISEKRREEIVSTFECSAEKIQIIYNGVDPDSLFGLSSESKDLIKRLDLYSTDLILLMPVRVTKAKNFEFAIKLAAEIKKLNKRSKIVITGPPDPHDISSLEYYHELLSLRKQLNVDNEVKFVYESGPKPGENYFISQQIVSELYRVADAMLMTSHREGFGMPVLEAGLLGIPVISTPIPATNELLQDNALVFSLNTSPSRLAEEILSWMKTKPEHSLRVKVRQNYTWESIFRNDILPLLETQKN